MDFRGSTLVGLLELGSASPALRAPCSSVSAPVSGLQEAPPVLRWAHRLSLLRRNSVQPAAREGFSTGRNLRALSVSDALSLSAR